MALEQSENRDTKTLAGIVGFSTNPGAVNRWFLTAHVRASVTRSLKKMCGLDIEEDDSHHKESGLRRMNQMYRKSQHCSPLPWIVIHFR